MAKQTFRISASNGDTVAHLTLFNYGVNCAVTECREVAKQLTGGDYAISRVEPETPKPSVQQFINDHVGE
jgi:hypothetical protein